MHMANLLSACVQPISFVAFSFCVYIRALSHPILSNNLFLLCSVLQLIFPILRHVHILNPSVFLCSLSSWSMSLFLHQNLHISVFNVFIIAFFIFQLQDKSGEKAGKEIYGERCNRNRKYRFLQRLYKSKSREPLIHRVQTLIRSGRMIITNQHVVGLRDKII